MKKKSRYPDHIVWDEETEKFNAFLLPYGSNVSAPVIKIDNVDGFKNKGVSKIEKIFNSELEELVQKYYNLVEEAELTASEVTTDSNIEVQKEVAEVAETVVTKTGYYGLQVGLFDNKKSAENEMKKFLRKRMRTEVKSKSIDGDNKFAVVIGNYSSLESAKAAKIIVQQQCDCEPIVFEK